MSQRQEEALWRWRLRCGATRKRAFFECDDRIYSEILVLDPSRPERLIARLRRRAGKAGSRAPADQAAVFEALCYNSAASWLENELVT
jgi:hypothetical protein